MWWGGRGAVYSPIDVIYFQNIYKLSLGLSFVILIIAELLYIFLSSSSYADVRTAERSNADKIPKLEYLWFDHFIHCKLKIFVNGVSTLTFFSFQGVDSYFNI